MAPRAIGAFLALAAAILFVVAITVQGWWTGNPAVEGRTITAKTVGIGLVTASGCNVGGDGTCESIKLADKVVIARYVELGATALATLFAILLMFAALRISDGRKLVAKVSLAATALATLGGAALLLLGPGIEATQHVAVPIGWPVFVFGGAVVMSVLASVVTRQLEPEPLRLKSGRRSLRGITGPKQRPASPVLPTSPAPAPAPRADALDDAFAHSTVRQATPITDDLRRTQPPAQPPAPRSEPAQIAEPPRPPIAPPPPVAAPPPPPPPPDAPRPVVAPPPPRVATPPVAPPVAPLIAEPPRPPIAEPPRPPIAEPPRAPEPPPTPLVADPPRPKPPSIPPKPLVVVPPVIPPVPPRPASKTLPPRLPGAPTSPPPTRTKKPTVPMPEKRTKSPTLPNAVPPPPDKRAGTDAEPKTTVEIDAEAKARAMAIQLGEPTEIGVEIPTAPSTEQLPAQDPPHEPPPVDPPTDATPGEAQLPISTAPADLPPPRAVETMPTGPRPACPQCASPMSWVEEHLRFYCSDCKMYF